MDYRQDKNQNQVSSEGFFKNILMIFHNILIITRLGLINLSCYPYIIFFEPVSLEAECTFFSDFH